MRVFKKHSQSGMTFIEVLVAFVIIVAGVLGAVALQATAKKSAFDAMQRSVASAVAQDIVERIRNNSADPNVLESYVGTDFGNALNAVPNPRCNTADAVCTDAQVTANDLFEWERALMGADVSNAAGINGGLLNARACIAHLNNRITVIVSWDGREDIADSANADFVCGGAANNSKRRQINLQTFIF